MKISTDGLAYRFEPQTDREDAAIKEFIAAFSSSDISVPKDSVLASQRSPDCGRTTQPHL